MWRSSYFFVNASIEAAQEEIRQNWCFGFCFVSVVIDLLLSCTVSTRIIL